MQLTDFDYHLPDGLIAARAAEPRDSARLLVVRAGGPFEDRIVADLPDLLRRGDLLVLNDTKVIPARLRARRTRGGASGAAIELLLLKSVAPNRWSALARPAKRLRADDRLEIAPDFTGRVVERGDEGEVLIEFDSSGDALQELITVHGEMPLPPYIAALRPADASDYERYQTVYARDDAAQSVAAPTAGLHFTAGLLTRLTHAGIGTTRVTLHVGAGTFLPVKTEDIAAHPMHAEWGEITPDAAATINATRQSGGRIVAVGTTAARLLESATDDSGKLGPFRGDTALFIRPGYRFKLVNAMVTNFHLPKSTLLMLVAALMGRERILAAYRAAVERGYRFYSYGDACLLLPETAR